MQRVMAFFRAYFPSDESAGGWLLHRLAAREKVGPGTADNVFEKVGEEGCQEEGNEKAKDGDVRFKEAVRG